MLPQLLEVFSHKGLGPSYHGVQHYSQAPHVHRRAAVALPQEEFRGSIRVCAADHVQLDNVITLVAEAKVCNFDIHVGIKEEAQWLQVSVHDAPPVAVLQGRDQLLERASGLCLCHTAMGLQIAVHVPPH